MSRRRKVTHGWVTQIFDEDGNCLEQNFYAGDIVEYEDDDFGDTIDPFCDENYQPFDMVQPVKDDTK